MTIVIAGEIDLAPERRDAALLAAQPLIVAAKAEAGCLHYDWTADPATPGRVHVFEQWASEADLAAHFVGEPYRAMREHLGASGLIGADTRKYRVDLIEPVYDATMTPRADFFTKPT